jgi:hypothetical protein
MLEWLARDKHSSLFTNGICDEESFMSLTPDVNVIKLFSFVTDDKAQ